MGRIIRGALIIHQFLRIQIKQVHRQLTAVLSLTSIQEFVYTASYETGGLVRGVSWRSPRLDG